MNPRGLTALGGLVLIGATGCTDSLEEGEYGTFRYAGQVRGEPPMQLLPPVSDRAGNVYVLYGGLDILENELFVGHAGGGWTSKCTLTAGNDYGVHGFVGRAEDEAWYWSGDALVRANGRTGACARVLERDPSSGTNLAFRAVVPWVDDTPSRTRALAWIQGVTDPVPFQVVLDLDAGIYTSPRKFSPKSATDIAILGVGGNLDMREGLVVVRYTSGGTVKVQGRFIDENGETVAKTKISGMEAIGEYGIVGFLQSNDQGLYAGLDTEGKILVIDKDGAKRKSAKGMVPVGVHEWEGQLWLVGTNESGSRGLVAEINNDGGIGKAQRWNSSSAAEASLKGTIDVVDDRRLPSIDTAWKSPKSALGVEPFVHPHRLDFYADGTTGWLVSGPDFDVGGDTVTAFAFAPVGISYP